MKYITTKILVSLALCFSIITSSYSQSKLTKEAVLSMTTEELSDLPLEELMYAVELLEVKSIDELFALIMNKNVSSASKKEEDSFKSPLSSSVLTKDEIRTYGCLSIEEALRLIPGVIVSERTNGEFDVHLRGLSGIPENNLWVYTENVSTLLMIDSRPVFNYAYGATIWESLPIGIEDVERIEIVRGPCSALYGSNAVTGVINIITEKGSSNEKLVSGSFTSGSQDTYTGDVAIRKSIGDKWHFGVSGNFQSRHRNTDEIYVMEHMVAKTGEDGAETDLYDVQNMEKFNAALAGGVSQADMLSSGIISPFYGGEVSVERLKNLRQYNSRGFFKLLEAESSYDDIFSKPAVSRENYGVNGYVHYTPQSDVSVTLTGGYQNSYVLSSPATDEFYSLSGRTSKTAYVNLQADVKGFSFQTNYFDGPQDFSYGSPAFKIKNQQFNGSLEYDWNVLDGLSIRPGVSYQWVNMDDSKYPTHFDYYKYYDYDTAKVYSLGEPSGIMPGFLNGAKSLSTYAGTVRADYTVGNLRAIAAFRVEKPTIPDKVYPTWQLGLSYAINENNFIRLVYGRAIRSSVVLNTSSDYVFHRTGINSSLSEMSFEGNEDANVMQCDNYEIGYRWRPAQNVLIDAEAFYSHSWDYGALMADRGYLMNTIGNISSYINVPRDDEDARNLAMMKFMSTLKTKSIFKYTELSAKVDQMGVSVNVDWIISDKLIAKAHANVQKTVIDNFYDYSQTEDISTLLTQSVGDLYGIIGAFHECTTPEAIYGYLNKLLNGDENSAPTFFYEDDKKNPAKLSDFADPKNVNQLLAMGRTYSTANALAKTRDNIDSKTMPSFYGMLGLIYKPVSQLSVSAFGYYSAEHEYSTLYSLATTTENGVEVTKYLSEKVDGKFTCNLKVGYRPTDEFEISFNARNLFNNNSREFAYADKIGGIYSIGINFGF